VANFDGLSKVTLTMTTDTAQAVGTPLTWGGNYSMQANCNGVVNLTTGGSATFSLAVYNQGVDFLMTGSDATYAYSANGNTQPSGCSTSTLSGVYSFNATGFALSAGSVSGAEDGAGLFQFDGNGNLTANVTLSMLASASNPVTLTGSYSVSSNCLGTATLTDSKANSYVVSFSISTTTPVTNGASYVTLAESSKLMISGNLHATYGQAPTGAE
jgi:hypothetical protein